MQAELASMNSVQGSVARQNQRKTGRTLCLNNAEAQIGAILKTRSLTNNPSDASRIGGIGEGSGGEDGLMDER
jgi:hypothetical protein